MRPAITPASQAGTRFTYPGGMEGWVDLGSLTAARPGIEPMTTWSQGRTADPCMYVKDQIVSLAVEHCRLVFCNIHVYSFAAHLIVYWLKHIHVSNLVSPLGYDDYNFFAPYCCNFCMQCSCVEEKVYDIAARYMLTTIVGKVFFSFFTACCTQSCGNCYSSVLTLVLYRTIGWPKL